MFQNLYACRFSQTTALLNDFKQVGYFQIEPLRADIKDG